MVADVHACARIRVLPPGSAHARILFEHRVGHARLLQPDRRQQARLPAPHHDDRKPPPRRAVGRHGRDTAIAPVELHLLEHHRHVLVRDVGADKPVHHAFELGGIDRRRLRTSAVAVVADDVQRDLACGRLVVLGHEPLDFVQEDAGGPQRAAEQRRIAAHVHTRHEQRGNRHVFQRRGDLRVRRGERRTGVHITRRFVAGHAVNLDQRLFTLAVVGAD